MVTVKADNYRRIKLPHAKPGQVFALEINGNDSVTIRLLAKPKPLKATKVTLIKKNGFTVGHSERRVNEVALKRALAEFP
jgi:hypothetical protein